MVPAFRGNPSALYRTVGKIKEERSNMNWLRIILDGLSMSLLFNAIVGLGFLLVPQAYSTMFPKEIKEAASPYVERNVK